VCLASKTHVDLPIDVCPFLSGAESLSKLLWLVEQPSSGYSVLPVALRWEGGAELTGAFMAPCPRPQLPAHPVRSPVERGVPGE
jgi:hypothetical protein